MNKTFMPKDDNNSNRKRYGSKLVAPVRKETSVAVNKDSDTVDAITTFGLGILNSSLYLDAIAETMSLGKATPTLTRHLFQKMKY